MTLVENVQKYKRQSSIRKIDNAIMFLPLLRSMTKARNMHKLNDCSNVDCNNVCFNLEDTVGMLNSNNEISVLSLQYIIRYYDERLPHIRHITIIIIEENSWANKMNTFPTLNTISNFKIINVVSAHVNRLKIIFLCLTSNNGQLIKEYT